VDGGWRGGEEGNSSCTSLLSSPTRVKGGDKKMKRKKYIIFLTQVNKAFFWLVHSMSKTCCWLEHLVVWAAVLASYPPQGQ